MENIWCFFCWVDGGWGNWTACNATCGAGTLRRACDNPAPENGGDVCDGETSQECDTGVDCGIFFYFHYLYENIFVSN